MAHSPFCSSQTLPSLTVTANRAGLATVDLLRSVYSPLLLAEGRMTVGQNSSPAIHLSNDPARRRRWMLYSVEAVTGLASTMLIISIFFYTEKTFHWSMRQNLLLAAVDGLRYVAGFLSAYLLRRLV